MICQVNQYLRPRVSLVLPGVHNRLPVGLLKQNSQRFVRYSYGRVRWSTLQKLEPPNLSYIGVAHFVCRWAWKTLESNVLFQRRGLQALFRKGYSSKHCWTVVCERALISRFSQAFRVAVFSWEVWLRTLFLLRVALSSVFRAANGTPDSSKNGKTISSVTFWKAWVIMCWTYLMTLLTMITCSRNGLGGTLMSTPVWVASFMTPRWGRETLQ